METGLKLLRYEDVSFIKKVNGGKSEQRIWEFSYWIWVPVLVLLDLRGWEMVGSLDLYSPSERKPTNSVSVEEKKVGKIYLFFNSYECEKSLAKAFCEHQQASSGVKVIQQL